MPQVDVRSVKEILDGALDLPAAERPEFLTMSCAGDELLRREVQSLLEQEDADQPWCEGPILPLLSRDGAFGGFQEDQRIGPYRIVRTLGEGGMGAVALAVRQDDFEKQVALKVVKPGRLSQEMTRRFETERQILAQLEHPNIARILDGGSTADGFPYFVMEYVEGRAIDEHCGRQDLSIRERLRLFLEVCSALQFAHQNLVVHRDLKPGNILVTSDGMPKLLDFGIAKQLEPQPGTEVTCLEQRPMSLRYASPEQIDGGPMTTASDIYSLGVLLCQLLAGQHPFSSKADDAFELAQAIRYEEPRSPSAAVSDPKLRKHLAGDLDSIMLKALRNESIRRYGSVEQLAADIRRYLEGEAVIAREGTWAYRAGKFARRHKLALVVTAAFVLVSLAFGVTATILARKAVSERERAVHQQEQAIVQRQRSEKVLDFMKGLFFAIQNKAKDEKVTAREILLRGEKDIESEFEDPLLQAELLATIGQVYVIQGLFDYAKAPWERAEYLLRQRYAEGHPALAKAINNRASWFYRTGDHDRAETLYREALAMKDDLYRDALDKGLEVPQEDGVEIDIAKSLSNLATILMTRGDYEQAERLYRQSLEIREKLLEPEHPDIATSLRSLGVLYYLWGDFDQAEPLLVQALEIRERLYGPEAARVATAVASLGRLFHAQGRLREAETLYTRSLSIRRQRLGEDHPHVAVTELDLARLYLDTDGAARGEAFLARCLLTLRETKDAESWEIAHAKSVLGGYLTVQGRYEEAETHLVEGYRTLAKARGEQAIYTRDSLRRLLDLYDAWGKPEEAAAYGGGSK